MGTLGKAIREERRKQNLKIKDLAERIGFSLSYVSQVERDLIVPSLSALRQIAGALDISPGARTNCKRWKLSVIMSAWA